jgi:trehalose/maltose hydrolase-like predicted phosphorylase
VDWTGDRAVFDGDGRALVLDTARYWAARVRADNGNESHLYGVIGPDEYHEVVDDNAYTNGMARWHLRRGADLARAVGDSKEADHWEAVADTLVDGFDRRTKRHEQFAGFWALEPLLIGEVAEPPVAADLLLGRDRVRKAQVIKQPDVLMLHHLIPETCPQGSLAADLDFYLPRTAHGSSLSPAICAALLARSGRPDDAMALFDVAARLDLDDITGTTAGGLHLATMGGLWQAVVFGFAGIRPGPSGLCIDPCLPARWERLTVRLRFRGVPLLITVEHDAVAVESSRPVPVVIAGTNHESPVRVPYHPEERSPR